MYPLQIFWKNELPAAQRQGGSFPLKLNPFVLLPLLVWLWLLLPEWLRQADPSAGSVDQSIWLLIVLGLICFLLICALCWWLLKQAWAVLALPPINTMVPLFNTLTSWQQISLYWASFALLLLAALGCLSAIC